MEEMIKELKEELLNKELTLLEMDNTVQRITEKNGSLFDYESDCVEQQSCAYGIEYTEEMGAKNIIVEWETIEQGETNSESIVKVVNIWED